MSGIINVSFLEKSLCICTGYYNYNGSWLVWGSLAYGGIEFILTLITKHQKQDNSKRVVFCLIILPSLHHVPRLTNISGCNAWDLHNRLHWSDRKRFFTQQKRGPISQIWPYFHDMNWHCYKKLNVFIRNFSIVSKYHTVALLSTMPRLSVNSTVGFKPANH